MPRLRGMNNGANFIKGAREEHMKILALYVERTLSILRRIQAPFSVLSTRGHSFSFMQIPTFDPGLGAGYDITVLPNWVLSDEENKALAAMAQHTTFAYDLSDPALLQIPSVRQTMALCRLITVPNRYLQKEVEIAVRGVKCVVLPSTIDIPYLMTANSYPKPEGKMIGCVGPYDWHLIKDAIAEIRTTHPAILFIGDQGAYDVLGDLMPTPLLITPETYPGFLRMCRMGLTPIEQERGQDTIAEYEYGLLGRPTLSLRGKKDAALWRDRIVEMVSGTHPGIGHLVHEQAKAFSAVRLADFYLKAYKETVRTMLPLSMRSM